MNVLSRFFLPVEAPHRKAVKWLKTPALPSTHCQRIHSACDVLFSCAHSRIHLQRSPFHYQSKEQVKASPLLPVTLWLRRGNLSLQDWATWDTLNSVLTFKIQHWFKQKRQFLGDTKIFQRIYLLCKEQNLILIRREKNYSVFQLYTQIPSLPVLFIGKTVNPKVKFSLKDKNTSKQKKIHNLSSFELQRKNPEIFHQRCFSINTLFCCFENKESGQGCHALLTIIRVVWSEVQDISLQLKSRSFTPWKWLGKMALPASNKGTVIQIGEVWELWCW